MQLYLRRRGAGRDGWKLSNWNHYIADVDTNFTPVLDHTVIVNDPDSEPLQDQARAFLTSIGTST